MGRATALAFAREGALVVGCGMADEPARATVDMVRAAGGAMVSLQPVRLADPAEAVRLVDFAVTTYGRIDVLFNLAGRTHFNWLEDTPDEDWDAARRDEVDLVFSKANAPEGGPGSAPRLSVPAAAATLAAFSANGLFAGLSGLFLSVTPHHPSHALAGFTLFLHRDRAMSAHQPLLES